HLNRLSRNIAERVAAARRVEDVVKKPVAAARVDAPKRSRLAAEHEKRVRPRAPGDSRPNRGELLLHAIGERASLLFRTDARTQRAARLGDVGQTPMLVRKHRNTCAVE